jgi:hypothetical protein
VGTVNGIWEEVGRIAHVAGQENNGVITLTVPTNKLYLLEHRKVYKARVIFDDERHVTADQRKAIFATMTDIYNATGQPVEDIEHFHKMKLLYENDIDYFTFSTKGEKPFPICDVTTANLFLHNLIEHCLREDILTHDSLLDRATDTGKYLYACLIYKKCPICQLHGELHHEDAIGSAYRKSTVHIGRKAICLCRIHHEAAHRLGKLTFDKRYNVFGIKIDETIAKKYRLPQQCGIISEDVNIQSQNVYITA